MKKDLRDILRSKAEKHQLYYQQLIENANSESTSTSEMTTTMERRQRRTGVYESPGGSSSSMTSMITYGRGCIKPEHLNVLDPDSTLTVPKSALNTSGYCSSASDDDREQCSTTQETSDLISQDKLVKRSDSTDSAMDNDEEEMDEEVGSNNSRRQSFEYDRKVPSRMLIEAQYVPIETIPDQDFESPNSLGGAGYLDSRRYSCISDDGGGGGAPRFYRYCRTPSVVVSDYSDDAAVHLGLTLEEVEYIRSKRAAAVDTSDTSPDSSLHSSCSNLNYCGSTISSLDTDYILKQPFRKYSDCSSTCSSTTCLSGGEENDTEASGWRKLRNIVQWTPFFQTYRKQRYPWVQLAGHQGNFKAGPDQGTILKKLCPKEEKCFKILMKDVLRPYVPEYKGLVASDDGECSYIQLQDLLGDFVAPCVMDCKIGVRTYLEDELAKAKEKPKLRRDMYEKMCEIDADAPTLGEHEQKAVTKPRYMVWRETISSTATLGFRIEGIRRHDGTSSKQFKTTKSKEQVLRAFVSFLDGFPHALPKYIQRLKVIKATLETSTFFSRHEVIGSSLLFVHDSEIANVWLIDFAKTVKLPDGVAITHSDQWRAGNHEDGYLIGISNLISIFMTMLEHQPVAVTSPLSIPDPPTTPLLQNH